MFSPFVVQLDGGDGWKSLVPKVDLEPFECVLEAKHCPVFQGEKFSGVGVCFASGSFLLCLSSDEDEAMEFAVELCSRRFSSLLSLLSLLSLSTSRLGLSALLLLPISRSDDSTSSSPGFVTVAVRCGSGAGRLWTLENGAAHEHLEHVPKRRAGRERVWLSVSAAAQQPFLFLCSPELVLQNFAETLVEASRERDVLAHLLASSNDGFGGGATMLCSGAPQGKHHVLGEFLVAHALTKAARPRSALQTCKESLRSPLGLNNPLAVSLTETASQMVLTCQTLSSGTLAVTSDGRSVTITMSFPEDGALYAQKQSGIGESEFYGPIIRIVHLPVLVDAQSKILVYDRNDGIVTVKYDIVRSENDE